MPDHWQGHPLRKSHPGRSTDMAPYTQADARRLQPRDGGFFVRSGDGRQDLIVNVGPHHVSTLCHEPHGTGIKVNQSLSARLTLSRTVLLVPACCEC